MRLLVLSIEFSICTFSGNGIYATSQVRALQRAGHDVLVICGCPSQYEPTDNGDTQENVVTVSLPTWGRLDLACSFREYAEGCARLVCQNARVAHIASNANLILGIDWHSFAAYQKLAAHLMNATVPPYACNNYRIFLRSVQIEEDRELMARLEGDSMRESICITVLSRADAEFARQVYFRSEPSNMHVLLPALRADIEALPAPIVIDSTRRRYLTCCVRASTEKEPHRFVDLVCELEKRGVFTRLGLTPLIAGAGWKIENSVTSDAPQDALAAYSMAMRQQLSKHAPSCKVIERFLGPEEMAGIYADTVLNIHPCVSDAYGMTVVEAASQGAPSLVNGGGLVGCTDLLKPERDQIFVMDMNVDVVALADTVEELLSNRNKLNRVGSAAMVAAREWSEDANGETLIRHLKAALEMYGQRTSSVKKKVAAQRGGVDVWHASELQYQDFVDLYLAQGRPVVLIGIAEGWRAVSDWVTEDGGVNIDALERLFGNARISAVDVASQNHGNGNYVEMSLAEYFSWWRQHKVTEVAQNGLLAGNEPVYYLKDWHMTSDFPAYEAYRLPQYFCDDWLNEWYDSLQTTDNGGTAYSPQGSVVADYRFVYCGPKGTSTPLHSDVLASHSWSVNVAGRKRWQVLPPAYSHLLLNKTGTSLSPEFDVDMAVRDCMDEYPGLAHARQHVLEFEQLPGEAVFVPSGWHHTVKNLDDCLSINHNWISSHSVTSTWEYLRQERSRAATLIEDCRLLNGPWSFELLVQRNVKANCGMDYTDFGAMLRFVVETATVRLQFQNVHDSSQNYQVGGMTVADAEYRIDQAKELLSKLVQEQISIGLGENGIPSEALDRQAWEVLHKDMHANQECIRNLEVK